MTEYCNSETPIAVSNNNIRVEFDAKLKSRVVYVHGGEATPLGDFESSHYIVTDMGKIEDFQLQSMEHKEINDDFGHGMECVISGKSSNLEKVLRLCEYDRFPSTIFINTKFKNTGKNDIGVTGWVINRYTIKSDEHSDGNLFWSFQGASYETRPDWILPLKSGFSRKNFMGMNDPDYGGGIPLTDIWSSKIGLAVGHCENLPKLVSLPVEVAGDKAAISVEFNKNTRLEPGNEIDTIETFVMLHHGDFYNTLKEYRNIMESRGIKFAPVNKEAYEPSWCAWGYERNFSADQIYNALPMVKKLGFKWICVDDGWQYEEGDYEVCRSKFPNGESDMKELVRNIHSQGLKAQLWWLPMACDPKSLFYAEHPDSVITGSDGKPQEITWWDNYYLCPSFENVREQTRKTVRKILGDWDFDGLKIDGQHLNAAPLCYNEAHHHLSPEESYEAVPDFFKLIYDEAKKIKPDALIMFCPCGTCCSFFTMPYFDMPVASDPESSWQVRLRGKAYKALLGNNIPYNSDHIELSDRGCDFASVVGIGGVINTKFTWPEGSGPVSMDKPGASYDLNPEKEALYHKWLDIYRDKMLSSGEYLGGLYDIGFDDPECHVIRKDGKMYYAFYADNFSGIVELRGLDNRLHIVFDYAHEKEIARLEEGKNKIDLHFEKFALIEVSVLD